MKSRTENLSQFFPGEDGHDKSSLPLFKKKKGGGLCIFNHVTAYFWFNCSSGFSLSLHEQWLQFESVRTLIRALRSRFVASRLRSQKDQEGRVVKRRISHQRGVHRHA